MKVLVVGATGNVGIRLVPALLTHKLEVVAYIRSTSKLQSLLPSAIFSQLTVVEGDAESSATIKKAILDHGCDAVVNTAGLASMFPWQSSRLTQIVEAVVKGARDAQAERAGKQPLRCWFMGGFGVLNVPGKNALILDSLPMFREHRVDFVLLEAVPTTELRWSMLCPAQMNPASSEFVVPTKATPGALTAQATTPPGLKDSWMKSVPIAGNFFHIGSQASRYTTTLEDNAEFIAYDLEMNGDEWVGKKVGVINTSEMPQT